MQIDPAECHPEMDYAEHKRSYALFLKATMITTIGVVALMAFLALFVA